MGIVVVLNAIWTVVSTISKIISKTLWYKNIFKCVGIVATRKFKPAKECHKYAIIVAARNESTVIGNLIDSIKRQNYPEDKLDIFVAADNCTDDTAAIARDMGAICYERFDNEHRTKGYALQYLVECIRRDYGIDAYEGYILFDADNLLASDYLEQMNNAFDAGEKIITSYRNTKNFDDNWIAASYGVHWLRTIRNEHRPRSLFHLATRIQGTGFLFAHELIKDGWNWVSLTEDRAFCADAVAKGYKISYNHDAIFYDEQPVSLRIAMRQRIRWAKGHLQAFAEIGPKLFGHIFITGGMASKHEKGKVSIWKRIFNNLRLRFMSLDILSNVYPRALFTFFKRIIYLIVKISVICILAPNVNKIGAVLLTVLWWNAETYLKTILVALYVYIIEHKRIQKIGFFKTLWFAATFPIFDIIGKISLIVAMFMKVEWKPIPHDSNVKITDLTDKSKNNKEKRGLTRQGV
ncbi:MAG: glycosyltransferase family 2 protein [Acutalibacteraceae bacterium]|nr:glycosyltransferase family 2 protein [Acutalibacteraceae bacterium]